MPVSSFNYQELNCSLINTTFPPNSQGLSALLEAFYTEMTGNPDFIKYNYPLFFKKLNEFYLQIPANDWPTYEKIIREHKFLKLAHECPFTKRIYQKPRGYAGDAVVLDYIYFGIPKAELDCITRRGQELCSVTINTPAARAVRNRARIIGSLVDTIGIDASLNSKIKVLSIACGHLREMATSRRFMQGQAEVVALDQDKESLEVVRKDYSTKNVQIVHAKIKTLLDDQLFVKSLGEFDLVYASGLFDYLDDTTAKNLTKIMYQLTKPNGITLITNFAKGIVNQAHMESLMDWKLIYRELTDLAGFASGLNNDSIRLFTDSSENIVFAACKKSLCAQIPLQDTTSPLFNPQDHILRSRPKL